MPRQILPAASLRSAQRLPAAQALFLVANNLIYMALWSIGRAIFRGAANFLPALREGALPGGVRIHIRQGFQRSLAASSSARASTRRSPQANLLRAVE